MLTDNIMDYYFVAQGKTTIPGVDDAEELTLTDVRVELNAIFQFLLLEFPPTPPTFNECTYPHSFFFFYSI